MSRSLPGPLARRVCRRRLGLLAPVLILIGSPAFADPAAGERRCGWFENPTPNNAWLIDRDRTWLIAAQAADAPEVEGDWPSGFSDEHWVRSNAGSYGFGCVCMDVIADPASGWITHILASQVQALAVCLEDRDLPLATGMERQQREPD